MAVTVTASTDGFRRCGVAFSSKPTHYDDAAFTPAQWATLDAEPKLSVTRGALPKQNDPDMDAIHAAIRSLGASDYGGDGKPRLTAVRGALGENWSQSGATLNVVLRDKAWDVLRESGFTAPQGDAA